MKYTLPGLVHPQDDGCLGSTSDGRSCESFSLVLFYDFDIPKAKEVLSFRHAIGMEWLCPKLFFRRKHIVTNEADCKTPKSDTSNVGIAYLNIFKSVGQIGKTLSFQLYEELYLKQQATLGVNSALISSLLEYRSTSRGWFTVHGYSLLAWNHHETFSVSMQAPV